MRITKKENRVFFDDDISHGNLSIHKNIIKIEMIKVIPKYRGKGFAAKLFVTIIDYIQKNFDNISIILSPMPILTGGKEEQYLNLQQLIEFYKKYKFKESNEKTREEPYLMVRDL